MGMHVEEGQYVVLYVEEGGAEGVYTTAYGEEQIQAAVAACKEARPGTAVRWAKAIRVAHSRHEPWTLEPGESE